MRVPTAACDGDEPASRFDQTPSQQAALPEVMPAVGVSRFIVLFAQIKCGLRGLGRDDAEGTLVVGVDGFQSLGLIIETSLQAIDFRKRLAPAIQPIRRESVGQRNVTHSELAAAGVAGHDKGVVLQPKVSGQATVETVIHIRAELDERRQRFAIAQLAADHRAVTWIRDRRVELVAGHHDRVGCRVAAVPRIEIPDEGVAVQLAGEVRHLIRKLNSSLSRVDDAKVASHFRSGIRFWIERVVMTGSAASPDEDAVDLALLKLTRRTGFRSQHLTESQPQGTDRAHVDQKLPATEGFAVGISRRKQLEHGETSGFPRIGNTTRGREGKKICGEAVSLHRSPEQRELSLTSAFGQR